MCHRVRAAPRLPLPSLCAPSDALGVAGPRQTHLHRPKRYSRPLRHVFYLSAQTSMIRPDRTATTTSRYEAKAAPTAKPSSRSLAAASMSSGRSYAMAGPGPRPHHSSRRQLDKIIEIPHARPGGGTSRPEAADGSTSGWSAAALLPHGFGLDRVDGDRSCRSAESAGPRP
jgi:hypothetical protein